MKCISIVVTALLFAVSHESFSAEQKCPNTIQNSYKCAQFLENELAKQHPRLFFRNGSKLVISLANGRKKTYVNIDDEKNHGADGQWFNLVQYYPQIGYVLVAVQYSEGSTYYLINLTTGKDNDIIGTPEISPDGKRIAVANRDLESRFTPNVLSVFLLKPAGLVVEFLEKPDDWGAGNLRWVSNEEISFVEYTFNRNSGPKGPDETYLKTSMKLKGRAGAKGSISWDIE